MINFLLFLLMGVYYILERFLCGLNFWNFRKEVLLNWTILKKEMFLITLQCY